jgi:hypothetical protein
LFGPPRRTPDEHDVLKVILAKSKHVLRTLCLRVGGFSSFV